MSTHQRLSKEELSVPSERTVLGLNESQGKTCQEKTVAVLESHRFQLAIVSLVVLDCIIVVIELILDVEAVIDKENSHSYHNAQVALHYFSLFILSIFVVEVAFKLYAFRLGFFSHFAEVFDAVVIIVSFVIYIIFHDSHNASDGLRFVIILRLWRIARIVNSVIMTVKIAAEKKLEHERKRRLELEVEVNQLKERVEKLKNILQRNGLQREIPDDFGSL